MSTAPSCESQPQPLLNSYEESQFADFYATRYTELVANFKAQGIPPDNCEDQAQEAMLRVLPRWQSIDKTEEGDWRYTKVVATNIGKDYLKSRWAQRSRACDPHQALELAEANPLAAPIPSPEELLYGDSDNTIVGLWTKESPYCMKDADVKLLSAYLQANGEPAKMHEILGRTVSRMTTARMRWRMFELLAQDILSIPDYATDSCTDNTVAYNQRIGRRKPGDLFE
jgi:hypothetical protein